MSDNLRQTTVKLLNMMSVKEVNDSSKLNKLNESAENIIHLLDDYMSESERVQFIGWCSRLFDLENPMSTSITALVYDYDLDAKEVVDELVKYWSKDELDRFIEHQLN